MSPTVIAIAGAAWLLLLFAAARFGEHRGDFLRRHAATIYTLSLAVYCTSWTFYGTVTQALRHGWWVPPTFVGTILVFAFATPLLKRLVVEAHARHTTSIADLLASRFDKSVGIAALATLIAVVGLVPYVALQLKAVAQSFDLLSAALLGVRGHDSAAMAALAMALFAMLFGTRRAGVNAGGVVLAMAFESLLKLLALSAVGIFTVFWLFDGFSAVLEARAALPVPSAPGMNFVTLIVLGALAMFVLPHQFHLSVVECRDLRHIDRARWAFPLYLLLMSVFVLPLAIAGQTLLAGEVPSDLFVLGLPLQAGANALALIAFLGGVSAAAGMVVMATLTLAIMVGNHWLAPLVVRRGRGDLTLTVLWQRRAVIALTMLAAYAYSRLIVASDALADVGSIAFAALAQLAPALFAALYWPNAQRRGVLFALAVGLAVWAYTLLLPALVAEPWIAVPFGLSWLSPRALFGLSGIDPLTHGVLWSLLANSFTLVLASRREKRGVVPSANVPRLSDLRATARRLLDPERIDALLGPASGDSDRLASATQLTAVEHALSALIGAASARLLLDAARRGAREELSAITEVVGHAREAVSFSHALIDTAMANLSQGISVVDGDLRLVAWNQRYAALLGYPPDFLHVGRPVAELFRYNAERGLLGPGAVDELVARRLGFLQAGSSYVFERQWPNDVVIEIRGNPIPGGGFVTTYTDISAFRAAEQALRTSNETLEARVVERTHELAAATAIAEQANAAKTRFLAAISHDLLQPLNAATLYTHALSLTLKHAEYAPNVRQIGSALKSTEALLAGLLDLSRLDVGGAEPKCAPFAVGELIATLAAEFDLSAGERGLTLRVVATKAWAQSDAGLVRRVLQNFVANALRYTARGGVLIGVRRSRSNLRLTVVDTGVGIEPADRLRVFEEFQRLDAARETAPEGLGLGLAISQRIARLLGHTIALDSVPGRGTAISIEVPACAAVPRPEPAASPRLAAGRRVLIVDNEPDGRAALAQLVAAWDIRVVSAGGLEDALAAAGETDVWILDYHLDGGLTGLALRERLRKKCGDRPTILISADHSAELKDKAAEADVQLVHKPVRPLALRSVLARVLGG